jgi:hypothetical protein
MAYIDNEQVDLKIFHTEVRKLTERETKTVKRRRDTINHKNKPFNMRMKKLKPKLGKDNVNARTDPDLLILILRMRTDLFFI